MFAKYIRNGHIRVYLGPMKRKAVALISGGLDSMLAAKIILEQGHHVEALNFFTGFCIEGHTQAIRKKAVEKQKKNNALWVAEQLNIKLHIIDIVEEYKNIVLNPKYGYGAHLNPCLDCKIFMIQKAKDWMIENDFDFIITGEVVGQRPKSQRKHLMPVVAEQSGANDKLLRPLSAKILPPTLPEREGWVDREKLLGLSGRNRNTQINIAKSHGLDYAQPAGGCCFLTNEGYTAKLKDFWEHKPEKNYELDDILLLKVGRHLRPRDHFKLIIGREEGENIYLEGYRAEYTHLRPLSHNGPLALLQGEASASDLFLAAQIVARYSDHQQEKVRIAIGQGLESQREIIVQPLENSEILSSWYIA